MTTSNTEIDLRAQVEAQQEVNQSFFDKMWKIVQQQGGVATEYKDSFKDVYVDIMKERYSGERGGALFSWIQEHNPNFDSSLYKKIQQSIEAQRDAFHAEQKKLISYQKTHKVFISQIPVKWFVGSRGEVDITVITSDETEKVFSTGKEQLKPIF